MDFQELVRKMTAIDTAPNAPVESKTDECGMPPMTDESPMMAPTMPPQEKEEATMNVNITAKGDAIQDVLKLMTKVNPDMINQPEKPEMPTLSIMSPGMDGPMDGPEGPDMPPMPKPINKLIPDFDGDNDDMPGGEKDLPKDHDDDHVMIKSLDKDGDDDHDMDDHDMEKDDKEDKEDDTEKEAWENEPDEDERSVHYQMNKLQGGMNRRKGTHPKVAGGDNAMQRVKEGDDLRASIRAELQKALAETKGAK